MRKTKSEALILAVLATAAAARAQEPPRRAVVPERVAAARLEVATGDGFFVVLDPASRTLAVYAVVGSDLRFLGARDVDADLRSHGSGPASSARPAVLRSDAAGQDPPGFPRPEKAIRVRTAFVADRKAGDGRWEARYDVPGSTSSVYDAIRASLRGWTLDRETVTSDPPRASAALMRPGERLEIAVDDRAAPEGWTSVEVTLSRQTD